MSEEISKDKSELECKYCKKLVKDYNYKEHLLFDHLDVNGDVIANALSLNTVPMVVPNELETTEDWIIDYSELVLDDPVFKYELTGRKYDSIFHEKSASTSHILPEKYKQYFIYQKCKQLGRTRSRFLWHCPYCPKKIINQYISLKHLILEACGHVHTMHRDDKFLYQFVENELKYFNIFHETNFCFLDKGDNMVWLYSDYILTGKESEFMIEQLHPVPTTSSDNYITCRLCFQYVDTHNSSFKSHIKKFHGYPHESHKSFVYVTKEQLERTWNNESTLKNNPFAFTYDEDQFLWKCLYCCKVIRNTSLKNFLLTVIGHTLLEMIPGRDDVGLEIKTVYKCGHEPVSTLRNFMLTNCKEMQKNLKKSFVTDLPSKVRRICPFCNDEYYLPERLDDDVAIMIHLYVDHKNKSSDVQIIEYLLTLNKSNAFPYLRVLFLDQDDKEKVYECTKCDYSCFDLTNLWNHAICHDNQILKAMQLDDLFLSMDSDMYNYLITTIEGIPQHLITKSNDSNTYVCINCNALFNFNDSSMIEVMQSHLVNCEYPGCTPVKNFKKSVAVKNRLKRLLYSDAKEHKCKVCKKQHNKAIVAKRCCKKPKSYS